MKFTRNARILRNQLDATPYAMVFFLLVMFMMLAGFTDWHDRASSDKPRSSAVIYKPGITVQLPVANDLPGTDEPTITVAMDANNRLFFANRLVSESEFQSKLREIVAKSPELPTLVVKADKSVTHENLVRLTLLARDAGIRNALLATSPQLISPNGKP